MENLAFGIQITLIGILVVFLTLSILALAIWLIGVFFKKRAGKIEQLQAKELQQLKLFTPDELKAITAATHLYLKEKEGGVLEIKERRESWKASRYLE
jgi:integral membrane protein (TIGR04561 family)